jgi:hypothetical protein
MLAASQLPIRTEFRPPWRWCGPWVFAVFSGF